ncbi:MAG TPA: MTH938/NDUFAF3 family protein [Xanthobacteraceae bacterium]
MARDPHLPHLPRAALIDAYGKGGFRFAGMAHRGSLLCLPNGIWAASVVTAADISEEALAPVFANSAAIDYCLIGAGASATVLPEPLRVRFRECGIAAEAMTTGAAVRTYNILFGEGRRVAALLIAVE